MILATPTARLAELLKAAPGPAPCTCTEADCMLWHNHGMGTYRIVETVRSPLPAVKQPHPPAGAHVEPGTLANSSAEGRSGGPHSAQFPPSMTPLGRYARSN